MSVTLSIPIHQVDAFITDAPFSGNPAAVCPLEAFLDDAVMQAIAASNNLSETAFLVPQGAGAWALRWFTPAVEVALCGHATLASAHALWTSGRESADTVTFATASGDLHVSQAGEGAYAMDFPALPSVRGDAPAPVIEAMGRVPAEVWLAPPGVHKSEVYVMAVYETAEAVAALRPDTASLARVGANVIATAPGEGYGVDVVSRFFAAASGIPEDPVTGSAHCSLAPYWAGRLGRDRLSARQISARGGDVGMALNGDRVTLTGRCRDYMQGAITLA